MILLVTGHQNVFTRNGNQHTVIMQYMIVHVYTIYTWQIVVLPATFLSSTNRLVYQIVYLPLQIFQNVIRWIAFDTVRHQYTKTLLEEIRLGLIPAQNLEMILSSQKQIISPDVKQMVNEVLTFLAINTTETPPLHLSHPHLFASRSMITVSIVK